MIDLLIPMAPLLWIGLFGWVLDLTVGHTVLLQAAFAVIAMLGCALGSVLSRHKNGGAA